MADETSDPSPAESIADSQPAVPAASGRRRRTVIWLVWALVAPVAGWALVRIGGWERGFAGVALIAFTPYVAAGSVLPLAVALGTRRWSAAAVAAVTAVALGFCVLPRCVPDGDAERPAVPGPRAVFMSANLLAGGADLPWIVDLVRRHHVDVLALQEFTPRAEQAFTDAGLAALLPYRVSGARPGVGGSALFARYPISDGAVRMNGGGFSQAYGTVTVPGARPVAVESVHPAAPSDAARAHDLLLDLAAQPVATPDGMVRVLIGDFNSTLDHAALRRLIDTGYRDAAATVGAGLTPTWPYYGARAKVTPRVAIDHVLADRRVGVADVTVFPVGRTDHRSVMATLVLPGP